MPPAVYSAPDPKRLCKERRSREAGDTFYLCFYYVIFWRPFEITVRPCTFWAYRSVLHKSSSSKKLCLSQVPLVFVIMAGKKRRDYKAVLDAVISIFPSPPRVTKEMLDFEKAVFVFCSARPFQAFSLKGVHSTGHKPYGERYSLKLLNPWLVKQIDFSLAIVRSVKRVHS